MKKLFLILILISAIAFGIMYITSPTESQKIVLNITEEVKKVLGAQTKKTADQTKSAVKQKAQETSESVVFELTNQAKETVNNVADATNTALEQKTQQVLGAVFQTTPSSSQLSLTPVTDEQTIESAITVIDFLSDSNKLFKFEKNKKNYVRFKNLPSHYCIYINTHKYELPQDKIIEITFLLPGKYAVSFDDCTTNDKFTDIVVE
jgi:hypothetical protein